MFGSELISGFLDWGVEHQNHHLLPLQTSPPPVKSSSSVRSACTQILSPSLLPVDTTAAGRVLSWSLTAVSHVAGQNLNAAGAFEQQQSCLGAWLLTANHTWSNTRGPQLGRSIGWWTLCRRVRPHLVGLKYTTTLPFFLSCNEVNAFHLCF